MGEMKFYHMRHGFHNNETDDLDFYTDDITVDDIMITAMIQMDSTGPVKKLYPILYCTISLARVQ